MTHTYLLVRDAILNRRQIVAWYKGHGREMCPHVLGLAKDGREQALFYQFGGASQKGLAPLGSPDNWRCIPLDGLSNVTVRDGPWFTEAPSSTLRFRLRGQDCVATIDVEVAI